MSSTVAAIVLLFVAGTAAGAPPAASAEPMTVAEALAAPAALQGRVVQVSGYLRPHVLYLFPSRALAEQRDWSKALIVGDDPSAAIRSSPCAGRTVEMTGTFRQLDPGVYGLTDILLVRLADGEVCWRAEAR